MSAKELVTAFFEEGYSNKNYDFIIEAVADNYVDHSPAGARSNADAVGILKIVADQFSDLQVKMLDIFAEGEMVATRVLYEGRHTGMCMGIAPPVGGSGLRRWKISGFPRGRLWNPGATGRIKKLKGCSSKAAALLRRNDYA